MWPRGTFNVFRIKKYYWYQKNIQKDPKKKLASKKLPPETYTISNHWAHHFLHNCAPIALIANSDANTNASVSGLLLHICRSVCINVWMYACTHVCMYVCIVCVCMHVFSGCMHVYVRRHKHQDASRVLELCTVAHTAGHGMYLHTKQNDNTCPPMCCCRLNMVGTQGLRMCMYICI